MSLLLSLLLCVAHIAVYLFDATGFEASLDTRMTHMSTRTGAALSGEVDRRIGALHDMTQLKLQELQEAVDKLAADKADMASLNHYTAQVR